MSKLNERENAFEKKFAHDEQLNFKIEARCAKLLGLFMAEKMGISGDEAREYSGTYVAASIEKPGFSEVLKKARADLDAQGIAMTDHMLQTHLEEMLEKAREQVVNEAK